MTLNSLLESHQQSFDIDYSHINYLIDTSSIREEYVDCYLSAYDDCLSDDNEGSYNESFDPSITDEE